jgi:hypothetical protein
MSTDYADIDSWWKKVEEIELKIEVLKKQRERYLHIIELETIGQYIRFKEEKEK